MPIPPARHMILRVWHVDPLPCPVCQNTICVIALIDDPQVVETSLRHPGVRHDPPPRPPPHGLPGFSPVSREGDFGGRTGNRK
jgi:hypothetical protein